MARTLRLGLAVGRTTLTAVEVEGTGRGPRPGRSWTFPLAVAEGDDLAQALAEPLSALRAAVGGQRVIASVALLRPLAQAKSIGVPRAGRDALAELLSREPRRWFVVRDEPVMADAAAVRSESGARVAVAVCAAASTVTSVLEAVQAAGFEVDRATAGAVALHAALVTLAPDSARGRVLVVARGDGWSELLLLDRGALRLAQAAPEGERGIADAVTWMSARDLRPARLMALDAGTAALPPAASLAPLAAPGPHAPAALAAFGATLVGTRSPMLLTPAARAARAAGARRRTRRILLAAAAVLLFAGALRQVALARDLAAVRAHREAIAPAVARAMVARRTVEAAREVIEGMAAIETGRPHWTTVLAAVAAALPDSTYLLSVTAEGSRMRLSGAAVSAESTIPALETSPLLSGVSLSAPIRRDEEDGLEYFELTATVAGAGGP